MLLDILDDDYQGTINSDIISAYYSLTYRKQKSHNHLGREFHRINGDNVSKEFRWLKQKVNRVRDSYG